MKKDRIVPPDEGQTEEETRVTPMSRRCGIDSAAMFGCRSASGFPGNATPYWLFVLKHFLERQLFPPDCEML